MTSDNVQRTGRRGGIGDSKGEDRRPHTVNATAARLWALAFVPLIVIPMLLATAPSASAAMIQIGTFDWDAIGEDEDEFLFFCESTAPCSRFTLTNDFDDLTDAELALLGLPSSDVAFDEVQMPGVVSGSLGSLTPDVGSFVWIAAGAIDLASVLFELPLGITGTLTLPTLTGPIGDPAAIYIDTGEGTTPVPEPTTLMLVGAGLLAGARKLSRGRRLS